MKKLILIAALALCIPAAAIADATPTTSQSAEAACRAQRTAMGETAFKALYNPTGANPLNAFGKCVSTASRSKAANDARASAACSKERADAGFAAAHGGKSFDQYYGKGKGKNAYGKCVSARSDSADKADQQATISAAKSCKSEQTAGRDAFKQHWGTNANKSNAFGKCVSAKAKAAAHQ